MWRAALDPGLNSPGLSLFRGQQLYVTRHVKPRLSTNDPAGARCLEIADQIALFIVGTVPPPELVELIFEWPQHYDHTKGKTKGDPNNLTPLAGIGMAVAGMLYTYGRLIGPPVTPKPAEWIGQLPKKCAVCDQVPGKKSCKACRGSAWRTPRGYKIEETLSPDERTLVPDQNDVIDSVGIGLWRVGRLNLRAQFPGLVTG